MRSLRPRVLLPLWISIALVAPLAATAVVKVYDATPPHGAPGDVFLYTATLCPPVQQTPGSVQGAYGLSDTGGGTVTMSSIVISQPQSLDLDLLGVFGPGAFVFIDGITIWSATSGQTGVGSTAPSGAVDWGVLGGWTRSGFTFCVSSPGTICTGGVQVPHGITVADPGPQSPTYDLGTWTFDAEGDLQAASSYIFFTSNGGTSNGQYLLRGTYVGGGVPAAPLFGIGALAAGLVIVGIRAVSRGR